MTTFTLPLTTCRHLQQCDGRKQLLQCLGCYPRTTPPQTFPLNSTHRFLLQVPSNYTYLETPIQRVERGPQPERSPVLGRFEAPNGQPGLITVLTRRAQAFKQTLLQVCRRSRFLRCMRGWLAQLSSMICCVLLSPCHIP
jgi:hypothetical protein